LYIITEPAKADPDQNMGAALRKWATLKFIITKTYASEKDEDKELTFEISYIGRCFIHRNESFLFGKLKIALYKK